MENPITENQRRAAVVSRLADVSFGTMWWLREWMWKEIIPPELRYDLDSEKPGHPGVSILGGPTPQQNFVPVMHGRSHGSRESVFIAGFDPDDVHKRTAFGHLIRPGKFPQLFLAHFPVDPPSFRSEWLRLFGADCPLPEGRRQMVYRVENKTKATPEECEELRALLRRLRVI